MSTRFVSVSTLLFIFSALLLFSAAFSSSAIAQGEEIPTLSFDACTEETATDQPISQADTSKFRDLCDAVLGKLKAAGIDIDNKENPPSTLEIFGVLYPELSDENSELAVKFARYSDVDNGGLIYGLMAEARRENQTWMSVSADYSSVTDIAGDRHGISASTSVGYDTWISQRFFVGGLISHNYAKSYSGFNVDANGRDGYSISRGVTVGPYVGYMLTPWLISDTYIGYSRSNYKYRNSGNFGKTDGHAWTGATNLTAVYSQGQYGVAFGVGYLASRLVQKAYTDSSDFRVDSTSTSFRQVNMTLRANAVYSFGSTKLSPNISARLEHDTLSPSATPVGSVDGISQFTTDDNTGAVFGAGVNISFQNDVTLSLDGRATAFRENFDSYGLSAGFNYAF